MRVRLITKNITFICLLFFAMKLYAIEVNKFNTDGSLDISSKKLTHTFSQEFLRSLDLYENTWFMSTSINIQYSHTRKDIFSLTTGYDTVLISEDGHLLNNYVDDEIEMGLANTLLGFRKAAIFKTKNIQSDLSLGILVPTSKYSISTGMFFGSHAAINAIINTYSWLSLMFKTGLHVNHYKYEESDASGSSINSPFSAFINSGFFLTPLENFSLLFLYGWNQRYDYRGDWQSINSILFSSSYYLTSKWSLSVSYSYKDFYYTDGNLFDSDKSLVSLGVSYVL